MQNTNKWSHLMQLLFKQTINHISVCLHTIYTQSAGVFCFNAPPPTDLLHKTPPSSLAKFNMQPHTTTQPIITNILLWRAKPTYKPTAASRQIHKHSTQTDHTHTSCTKAQREALFKAIHTLRITQRRLYVSESRAEGLGIEAFLKCGELGRRAIVYGVALFGSAMPAKRRQTEGLVWGHCCDHNNSHVCPHSTDWMMSYTETRAIGNFKICNANLWMSPS